MDAINDGEFANFPGTARSDECPIIELDAQAERLGMHQLVALGDGRAAACRIKRFSAMGVCAHLSRRIIERPDRAVHGSVADLEIMGMPYFLAIRDERSLRRYYRAAEQFRDEIRSLSEPYSSPLDAIIGLLNDAWPCGATAERLECGLDMSPAIVRVFKEGVGVLPHHDKLADESADSQRARDLLSQLSLNLYLSTPPRGGELELYLRDYDRPKYERLARGSYGLPPSAVGAPRVVLRPDVGELILFSSRGLHAVAPGSDGYRVTLSMFIGLRGPHQPLTFWS